MGLKELQKAATSWVSFGKRKKQENARIDYWDIDRDIEKSFVVSCDQLVDASVSLDGKFAVALEPGRASVIPAPKEKIRRWEYNAKPIEVLRSGKDKDKLAQQVFLSSNGKYIIRQSPSDNRIELFDRKGKLVNAYAFQRYNQGFNGKLFTPDDYYLIAHKSDEVFYWHPQDDSIPWPQFYELDLGEKQAYGLTTFIDYIPGTKDSTKWWAIGILLLSMVYALLYFSGAIIQFIQRKSYLELGLYGAAFGLFTLVLIGIWIGGTEDAPMKKWRFTG
ncbi:MAG: hypothetical protein IPJ40_14460 [Saprospirales bacterium]|nr:hypothetical protein [Saprospirales bacterium]